MFTLIDALDMKVGEIYFLKNRHSIIGEVIFVKYYQTNINNSPPFVKVSYPYKSQFEYSYIGVKDISIYRYVSEEEYWERLKKNMIPNVWILY
jgi:hypothetical protein